MASARNKKHGARQKRLNKYVCAVVVRAGYFFDVGFARGYSTLSALDKLRRKYGLRLTRQWQARYGSGARVEQHMLANMSKPGTGIGHNGEQYMRVFTVE